MNVSLAVVAAVAYTLNGYMVLLYTYQVLIFCLKAVLFISERPYSTHSRLRGSPGES